MMYRIRKPFLLIICCIALFVGGIYYDVMANFFLSPYACIGYLFIISFLLTVYICYLKYETLRIRFVKDMEITEKQREIYDLQSELRNIKNKTKKKK